MKLRIDSLDQTQTLARLIADLVRPRDMIVLTGEMGAGKTTFTQSLGEALGVTEMITSPTFNLLHNYQGQK
ncbi:MAG: tRNA (adenosine(37)-N6)-threonylcarbamoyltransferase complex ATPase subunit type 1 TsaE, partial [Actinomycetota bacterium]